jgi:hypothetical protein
VIVSVGLPANVGGVAILPKRLHDNGFWVFRVDVQMQDALIKYLWVDGPGTTIR